MFSFFYHFETYFSTFFCETKKGTYVFASFEQTFQNFIKNAKQNIVFYTQSFSKNVLAVVDFSF